VGVHLVRWALHHARRVAHVLHRRLLHGAGREPPHRFGGGSLAGRSSGALGGWGPVDLGPAPGSPRRDARGALDGCVGALHDGDWRESRVRVDGVVGLPLHLDPGPHDLCPLQCGDCGRQRVDSGPHHQRGGVPVRVHGRRHDHGLHDRGGAGDPVGVRIRGGLNGSGHQHVGERVVFHTGQEQVLADPLRGLLGGSQVPCRHRGPGVPLAHGTGCAAPGIERRGLRGQCARRPQRLHAVAVRPLRAARGVVHRGVLARRHLRGRGPLPQVHVPQRLRGGGDVWDGLLGQREDLLLLDHSPSAPLGSHHGRGPAGAHHRESHRVRHLLGALLLRPSHGVFQHRSLHPLLHRHCCHGLVAHCGAVFGAPRAGPTNPAAVLHAGRRAVFAQRQRALRVPRAAHLGGHIRRRIHIRCGMMSMPLYSAKFVLEVGVSYFDHQNI